MGGYLSWPYVWIRPSFPAEEPQKKKQQQKKPDIKYKDTAAWNQQMHWLDYALMLLWNNIFLLGGSEVERYSDPKV